MTTIELLSLGFKKKNLNGDYWYELCVGKHTFLTNDSVFNNGRDNWIVGYQHKHDDFWFNNRLKSKSDFLVVFKVLTGKELNQ